MGDLISVIVPVYNVENYLDACLESIASQTYQNLEILVVDDGSTDSSGVKCDEWARRDPRIRVIHQDNLGLSGARNAALDVCKGVWITFVDSDDVVNPEYVSCLYDLVCRYHVEISQCSRNAGLLKKQNVAVSCDYAEAAMNSREFLLSEHSLVMAWGKLYARELFREARYPLGHIHEDVALTHQLVYNAGRVAYTDRVLYFCNQRPDSINSTERFYLQRLDILRYKKEQIDFYREKNEPELAQQATRGYAYELLACYDKTRRILKRHDIAEQIRREYCKVWKQIRKDEAISARTKALLAVCCLAPTLWIKVTGGMK